MAMTEQQIIDTVFALYETDTTGWDTTSEEYLAARTYCNVAIGKWEHYDNTEWRDLWGTLTAAATGTKTLTAGTTAYLCPTNFVRASSWVRTVASSGAITWWQVIPVEMVAKMAASDDHFCYFTGNVKDGFYVNFNSRITLTTGDTINYEYYKSATQFSVTSSTTEIPDPYYIVYFVLARFLHNDGEDNTEELQEADDRLETMRVKNMSLLYDIPDTIQETLGTSGFEA